VTDERWRKELFPKCHGYGLHEIQDPGSAREQVEQNIVKSKQQKEEFGLGLSGLCY
jgi:hypothetical protein